MNLNARIKAWLAARDKPLVGYTTGADGDEPERILSWDTKTLGDRPSEDELAAVNVPPAPQRWTPQQIVNAFETMGIANVVLENTPALTLAKFYTAPSVPEGDSLLLQALDSQGKTLDDLKAAIK